MELRKAEVPPAANTERSIEKTKTEEQECFTQLRFLEFLKDQASKYEV